VKKKEVKGKEISENIKILGKENDEFIIRELEIPYLNSRKTYVNVIKGEVVINYEKKELIDVSAGFSKKKKFVKRIELPQKADPKTIKYKTYSNKVIITFKKKK